MRPLKRHRRRPAIEPLEVRCLLAGFGTPWPEPRSLSVSFPSDQAAIGAYRNSIREVFDQVTDRREWQEAALRAFQTWAVHADLNIGLVPDRGDAFGAVGLSTDDPRFGEFRIGAFPQPGVLANALPYQSLAGTWSGDVLLDTQTNYFLGDWNSEDPIDVPEPNEKGPAVELFSVLLHEAGNALGLPDNDLPGAVMNGRYSGPNGTLQPSDIEALRALYGPRRDIYETTNNDTRRRASHIATPVDFDGNAPLSVMGSLNTRQDVDYYRFRPLGGQEKVTVRLWASGISLLKARLEVLDARGEKIADAKADSLFENNLELEIGSLEDHSTLLVRVAANTEDVFAIGDYRIDLDYRPPELQPEIKPPPHDADDEDDDDDGELAGGEFISVDALFATIGLVDPERGANDTLETATPLETTPGFLAGSRYELQSSLSSSADRDLWSFAAPAFDSPTLQVTVEPVGLEKNALEVVLLNAGGDRLAANLTRNAEGGVSLTAPNPPAGEELVLVVRGADGAPVEAGNYVATMDFATNEAGLRTVFSSSLDQRADNISRLRVPKTQLFRFDLAAEAASADQAVQLSLYDARSGEIVTSFAAVAGATRTQYVWLGAGDYYLRATSRTREGATPLPVLFTLRADGVSDDQGPNPIDPTMSAETADYPDWEWEETSPEEPPAAIDYVEPTFEDPWTSDSVDEFYFQYYQEFLA